MSLPKVTPTHYLIQIIDETIRDLNLRKAQLIATLPEVVQTPRMEYLECPSGKRRKIQKRKIG